MQYLRSHYVQYVRQLMYVAHPDMQCVSLYVLTFGKTHFICKQTINSCCITFNCNPLTNCKDAAMLLDTDTPTIQETELSLRSLVSELIVTVLCTSSSKF
jgi:hypothetical protein